MFNIEQIIDDVEIDFMKEKVEIMKKALETKSTDFYFGRQCPMSIVKERYYDMIADEYDNCANSRYEREKYNYLDRCERCWLHFIDHYIFLKKSNIGGFTNG